QRSAAKDTEAPGSSPEMMLRLPAATMPASHGIRAADEFARLRTWAGLLLAAIAFVVAGCAGPTRISGEGDASDRTGRVAVNVADAGAGPEAVQGGFAWRDTGGLLRIDLVNPLGSTLARISVEDSGAVLEHANGTIERAPDADALLAKVVGVALP